MTDTPDPTMPPPPSPLIKVGVLLASGIGLLSALAGVIAAFTAFPKPLYGLFGFELVCVVAGVLGVLAGLGKFRSGYALALLCVAGTFFTSAIFGLWLDARQNAQTPSEVSIVWGAIYGRIGLGMVLGALAGLAVLMRERRSWGYLIKGARLLAPVLAIVAWVGLTGGRALTTPLEGALEPIRMVALVLGALVMMVVFSIGAHLCIRAFEITRPDDNAAES